MTDAVARVFRDGGDFLDMLKAEKEARMDTKGICVHCGRGPLSRAARGLCFTCYSKREIREQYKPKTSPATSCKNCGGPMPQNATANQLYCCRKCQNSYNGKERYKSRSCGEGGWEPENKITVSDPFTSGRFADGLPGTHAMICPMEGMYSQPERGKGEAA